jgi:hypothetical protein
VAKDLRTRVRRFLGEAETNIVQDRAARIMQHVSAPGEGGMYHASCRTCSSSCKVKKGREELINCMTTMMMMKYAIESMMPCLLRAAAVYCADREERRRTTREPREGSSRGKADGHVTVQLKPCALLSTSASMYSIIKDVPFMLWLVSRVCVRG